jgi:hypothetical protein
MSKNIIILDNVPKIIVENLKGNKPLSPEQIEFIKKL